MAGLTAAQSAALEPLREALLAQARAEADRIRRCERRDGEALVAEARQEAATILAEARSRGEMDAAAEVALERSRGRRAARAVVLEAGRATFEELVRQARRAVCDQLSDPSRRKRLVELVEQQLGPLVTVEASSDGGVVGHTADGRRIDASVPAVVDAAVASIDLEELWSV